MIDQFAGVGSRGGEAVDPCEGRINPADYHLLFAEIWQRQLEFTQ